MHALPPAPVEGAEMTDRAACRYLVEKIRSATHTHVAHVWKEAYRIYELTTGIKLEVRAKGAESKLDWIDQQGGIKTLYAILLKMHGRVGKADALAVANGQKRSSKQARMVQALAALILDGESDYRTVADQLKASYSCSESEIQQAIIRAGCMSVGGRVTPAPGGQMEQGQIVESDARRGPPNYAMQAAATAIMELLREKGPTYTTEVRTTLIDKGHNQNAIYRAKRALESKGVLDDKSGIWSLA